MQPMNLLFLMSDEHQRNVTGCNEMPLPSQWRQDEWPNQPALAFLRRYFGWAGGFSAEEIRNAIATYYAMCTYVDQKIGQVLAALEEQGLTERTRIIYTSDHGAMMGAKGLWGKFTMYEEAAAIPFLLAGPDVPQDKVVNTPISLVDCFPTIVEAVGARPSAADAELPGESLWAIAQAPDRERTIFSEYHAAGTRNGIYMVCDGRYKYIHYLHEPAQLFDLVNDPAEEHNLAGNPVYQATVADYEGRLRAIVDPVAVDAQAKTDQQAKLEAFGGEEAILKRGLSNSAIPGEAPVFHQLTQ